MFTPFNIPLYLELLTLKFFQITQLMLIPNLYLLYIKVHTATRWTIRHSLVLLWFTDLMNVTEVTDVSITITIASKNSYETFNYQLFFM